LGSSGSITMTMEPSYECEVTLLLNMTLIKPSR
jgi:hypothetical protein